MPQKNETAESGRQLKLGMNPCAKRETLAVRRAMAPVARRLSKLEPLSAESTAEQPARVGAMKAVDPSRHYWSTKGLHPKILAERLDTPNIA